MMHTYRSSKIWIWFALMLPVGCAICGLFIIAGTYMLIVTLADVVAGGQHDTPTWFSVPFALAFFSLGTVGGSVWVCGAFDMCYELRLSDDGTCEFRSLVRRRRVHAQQIVSFELDDGTTNVRYRGGKLHLLETDDFADFLTRLKELNPAVEVNGPERWSTA